MRLAMRFGWAVAVGVASAGGTIAQTTGVAAGGAGTTNTGNTSAASVTSGGGGSTFGNGSVPVSTLGETAVITGTTIGSTTSPSSVDRSNVLGGFYANPQYQGSAGATENTPPGGFGTPLYGSTLSTGVATGAARTVGTSANSSRATGTSNSGVVGGSTFTGLTSNAGTSGRTGTTTGAGRTTGFGGTTTGFGGAGGRTGGTAGGFGGAASQLVPNLLGTTTTNSLANPIGGQVVPLPRPIAYTAVPQFRVAVTPPAVVQTNLQSIIDGSTQIASRGGVQVTAEAGGVVVLRGAVRDEDEARTAEGMIRLTPGIRDVRNELTYPTPTATP